MKSWFVLLFSLVSLLGALAEQCGKQAGGALCPGGLCCSQYGYCGTTDDYCKIENGCQSQCDDGGSPPTPVPPTPTPTPVPPTPSPSGGDDVSSLISQTLFDEILKHRNDSACFGAFYTYDAFIAASRFFNGFGTTGDTNTRKREIVAFLAQTSHETTGGWATAPDGPYAWGYCFVREQAPIGDYCQVSAQWPCVSGKRYYGRGPIQISWNYNYGQAGEALGLELLHNPDLVETDPLISFKTAIWFWMTPQYAKPSCHAVITGQWTPTDADTTAGRVPGYGVITNIINGGLECGQGYNEKVASRIGFYKKYCDKMGLDYGDNLHCYTQRPFGQTALLLPE